jgi:hypothetical protein
MTSMTLVSSPVPYGLYILIFILTARIGLTSVIGVIKYLNRLILLDLVMTHWPLNVSLKCHFWGFTTTRSVTDSGVYGTACNGVR